MILLVPMITRAISLVSDVVVLGITIWKTFYIFRMYKEETVSSNVAATLVYNGNIVRS